MIKATAGLWQGLGDAPDREEARGGLREEFCGQTAPSGFATHPEHGAGLWVQEVWDESWWEYDAYWRPLTVTTGGKGQN